MVNLIHNAVDQTIDVSMPGDVLITIQRPHESDAEKCRRNGWTAGTRLIGDEGYGPTVIELTAIGEHHILAKEISHNGELTKHSHEQMWTLACRGWKLA